MYATTQGQEMTFLNRAPTSHAQTAWAALVSNQKGAMGLVPVAVAMRGLMSATMIPPTRP